MKTKLTFFINQIQYYLFNETIMKKSLFLLMAALLLPLLMNGMDLQPNQKLMGHYTTDDIALGGCWGKTTFFNQVVPIATDITPDELAFFQGGKIVAFRVGLSTQVPVSRVFVIPVYADNSLGEVTAWPCEVDAAGWNVIELDEPYLINLPSDARLRIGFDFKQLAKEDLPISAVNVGTIYPSYCYRVGAWVNYALHTVGNLSVQCIVENDDFPQYVIMTSDLHTPKNVIANSEMPIIMKVRNLGAGQVLAGGCLFDVAIDGEYVCTISNTQALTDNYEAMTANILTNGLTEGEHTITVTVASVNGEEVDNPCTLSSTFTVFTYGFLRQKRLVEQFTSTYCTYCPSGTNMLSTLSNMRGDIAWVAIHQNMNGTDPFRTAQCDTIKSWEGCDGYPEASFDRTAGMSSSSTVCNVISYVNNAEGGANQVNNFLNYIDTHPAWSQVNINSTYDPETRKAVITVDGDMVSDFDERMGTGCKLTVYILEDGLVAPQVSGGDNYVHNNVLRRALGSVKGVDLQRDGDYYKNEFTYTIPTSWNADNLKIVAFVSRPLRSNHLTDLYVDNANVRKLGEFDAPEVLRGDVNESGTVTIADVTDLINYLLTDDADGINLEAADCNYDEKVSIGDVTDLINFLLTDSWDD